MLIPLLGLLVWPGLTHSPVSAQEAAPQTASAPAELNPMALLLDLSNESDPRARHEIAVRLLNMKTPAAREAVLTLLTSRNSGPAKLTLCDALAELKIREPAFEAPLLALMQARENPIALRRAAAGALKSYAPAGSEIAEKIRAFRQEQDAILLAENHAALMRALHDCTPEPDRAALLSAWLKQPLALERYWALDIIERNLKRRIPDPNVLAQVRLLLADPDDSVRQKCVYVLRTLAQREDAPRLQQMLEAQGGQPVAVREAIYNALGVLGEPASIPTVIAGLSDPAASVGAEAATALKLLVTQRPAPPAGVTQAAVEALLRRVGEGLPDALLRERVIDAMSVIADPAFLETLVAHAKLSEPVPAVRQAAVRGIGRIGNRSALPTLLETFANDPDAGVREAAAGALGSLGTSTDTLERLRERLDPRVEPSVAVQAETWEAYLQVFERLSVEEQQQALALWPADGSVSSSRRIDLLTVIERRASSLQLPDAALARIREELGDALIAQSRPADAAPVLARGLEAMKAAPPEDQIRVAIKMIDSYLSSAPDKAAAAAAGLKPGPARDAVIERLLTFLESASQTHPASAALLLDRLAETTNDWFGPAYAPRFQRLRKMIPLTSRPASAAAAG